MDGRSLLEPLAGRDLLLGLAGPAQGVARDLEGRPVGDFVYIKHDTGETELYDLGEDPFQLRSLHADPGQRDRLDAFSRRLGKLRSCAGSACP